MGAAPIDLSAGMVPKSPPIDLSAGMVPKQSAPAPKGWWQTAKDNFNAGTQPPAPATSVLDMLNPHRLVQSFGAGAGDVVRSVANLATPPTPRTADQIADQGGQQVHAFVQDPVGAYARTAGQAATGALAGEIGSKAVQGVSGLPDTAARAVVGPDVDRVIPGDTVTPRQQYVAAKNQGVQLDLAQAGGGTVAKAAKRVTENSLLGKGLFEKLQAQNIGAVNGAAQQLMDSATNVPMSREDFGNLAKTRLADSQQAMNGQAGELFDQLTKEAGSSQPDLADVRAQAQKIISDNQGYYANHPELLKGGSGQAWSIVNSLAKDKAPAPSTTTVSPILDSSGKSITTTMPGAAPTPDTWTDLHRLRTDLMDQYRSPDIVGSRAEGWLKQLTGAVDTSMTGASSGLSPAQTATFRTANDIYGQMKDTFDNTQSKLYHVVRAPDGLTAANQLADVKPEVARFIMAQAPELLPQMQRQVISRLLNPAGNEVMDLRNLPSRFGRAQKESLEGVLSPQQIQNMGDLARTSRLVYADVNPSGSGKVAQAAAESGVIGTSLLGAAAGLFSGDVREVAGGLAPAAYAGANRVAAKALTSPGLVDRVMSTPAKGPTAWANLGASKLAQHISQTPGSSLTPAEITALQGSAAGRNLLMNASSVSVGSKAMRGIVAQIAARRSNAPRDDASGTQ